MTHTHDHHHDHDHNHNHDHHHHDAITIIDEQGNESLYEVLFTFESEDYGKSYVILYPAGSFDDDDVELQAYAYVEGANGEGELLPIEDEKEWEMVEEVLNTFMEEEGF